MKDWLIYVYLLAASLQIGHVKGRMSTSDVINSINNRMGANIELMDEKLDNTEDDDGVAHEVFNHDNTWSNGVVPYVIDSAFDQVNIKNLILKYAKLYIKAAMKTIESQTCVTFKEYSVADAPKHHVHIVNGKGCWSYVGRTRSNDGQKLSLMIGSSSQTCLRNQIILHELLHVLGFIHEHCRADRDPFIKIYTENIEAGKQKEFEINLSSKNVVQKYDPLSVLHYSNTAFSKNGKRTLEWKTNPRKLLGGIRISKLDIEKIKNVYCQTPTTTPKKVLRITPKPKTKPDTKGRLIVVTSPKPSVDSTKVQPKKPQPNKIWSAGCKDRLGYCPLMMMFRGYCQLYGYRCPKSCRFC